jgi:FtsZ-interacting cell division protein YlmF
MESCQQIKRLEEEEEAEEEEEEKEKEEEEKEKEEEAKEKEEEKEKEKEKKEEEEEEEEELFLLYKHSNDLNLKICYKRYCSVLSKVILTEKKSHYNKIILNSKNKIRSTWKIIN